MNMAAYRAAQRSKAKKAGGSPAAETAPAYGDIISDATSAAASAVSNVVATQGKALLNGVVTKVVVDTALLPQVVVDHPFADGGAVDLNQAQVDEYGNPVTPNLATSGVSLGENSGDTFADSFLKILKPRVTVYTPAGPLEVAPWGEPPETSAWPLVSAGLLIFGVLAVYGGFTLGKKIWVWNKNRKRDEK